MNVATDWLSSNQIVMAALHPCVNAHSSEIWRKNRRTCVFGGTSSGSGQKSGCELGRRGAG